MLDHLWAWIGFGAFVLGMLALDLGILNRKSREVSLKKALAWSAVWIGLALSFNTGIYFWHGGEKALQFLTAYLVELSLSVDNLFVFLLVFGYFKVPAEYRHKALFWGILGALLMRAVFIAAGITLIAKFHWIVYVFGILLVASGIKMTLQKDKEIHPERNPVLKLFRRFMDVTPNYEGDRFFVKQDGRILASPLFVVVLILESADLVFAVDSVPAVLAVTPDPFVVFTSNVFAILGLRSMFFALDGVMKRFAYLQYGLSAVLVFVGAKMLLAGTYIIPTWVSLLFIVTILSVSILASLSAKRRAEVFNAR
ncbi:MAG TPA: TerC family protein [Candidatus Acidoferrum sp.]|jgi:tellurite resistance protein TerC|nr:TerC family protein [Candidatus Acidoferrum sp.]